MPIHLSADLLRRTLAAAANSPEREVCGLLLGDADHIGEVRAAANVASDPAIGFEIDPAVLFAALREARAGGSQVIGHYHSHPNGRSKPSAQDLAAAEPGKLWLIVGSGNARLWLAEVGSFSEMQLVVDD